MEPIRLDEHTQMLAEGFALGTLPQAESLAFAQRLAAGEPQALAALKEAQALMVALSFALPQQTPPAHLKEKILNAISREEKNSPLIEPDRMPASVRTLPQRTFRQSFMRSMAWAAVFLLLAVGYGYVQQQQRLALLMQEVESLRLKLAFHVQIEKTLQRPKRLMVALNATQTGDNATGAALVDREQARGYFMTDKLPALAANQDYQLWYIGNAGPVDAGVFQVDSQGYGVVEIRNLPKDLSAISAFAVTLEPKGGSAQPTLTQMFLLGKV